MPTLYLVRHAVTAATGRRLGGRTTAPLSEDGRAQAEAVAERFAAVKLAAVYASPLVRTLETAAPIAARHRLTVRELAGVVEFDYGRWTDRPLAQLRRTKLWRQIQQAPSRVTFPDGESFVDAQLRAVAAVEQLTRRHTDRQHVAVVTHADVIKLLVAHYAGVPLDLFQRLVVNPASVSALAVPRAGAPALLVFNQGVPAASDGPPGGGDGGHRAHPA